MLPLRTLKIVQTAQTAVAYVDAIMDPAQTWVGYPYKWNVHLDVTAAYHGDPDHGFYFSANDIVVGDWLATTNGGVAVQITAIVDAIGEGEVVVEVEDIGLYNIFNDINSTGNSLGPDGPGFIFQVAENGLPLIGPIEPFVVPPTFQGDLTSRFFYTGDFQFGGGSGSEFLQVPTDGSYDGGAIDGWTAGVTKQADAFDALNTLLAKALPPRPTAVQDYPIVLTNETPVVEGTRLANGLIPSYIPGEVFAYNTMMAAVDSTDVNSETIVGVGLGGTGTLTFKVNSVLAGERALTAADDAGTFGELRILDDYDSPAGSNGIWQAMDVALGKQVQSGINEFTLSHTVTGTATKRFVVENMLLTPVITGTSYSVLSTSVVYSSGVPHYTAGTTLNFNMIGENLVGRTFPAANMMGLITTPHVGKGQVDPTTAGVPSILEINNPPISVNAVPFTLDATNIAANSLISFTARNSFKTLTSDTTDRILYLEGTGLFLRDNTATYKRVPLAGNMDRPYPVTSFWVNDWHSGGNIPDDLGELGGSDAPIVGGKVKADQTNYSVGYNPAGPDFSAKPTTQYFSIKLQKITNRLKLGITGSFTSIFIALPGVPNDLTNTTNGWFDGKKQADFAPTLWPGHPSASDGCLLNQVGDLYEFTFGNISSAASDDNLIYVRFVLTGSDEISNIVVI